jgi:hypothetical protein
MDYKETIKERLNILSPELRAFVLDENWRREAEKIGNQFNLNEEKYASFENEIFLVLLCFEPPTDFAENIKRELEIDSNTANQMVEEVEKNIFSKVAEEINSMWQKEEPEEPQPQNNIGNDFEQIILNQAKAMMPAQAPSNLPTEQEKPKETIPNYSGGNDPYREPAV